jgi:prepilin-type N-terminal cleavage/methylation domain-containing protein
MTTLRPQKQKKDNGFTLPELAIVMIIFGFITSTALLALNTYTTQQRIERTTKATELSRIAINAWAKANGRYPCPARLDAAEGDTDYGFDVTWGSDPASDLLTVADDEADILDRIENELFSEEGRLDIDGDGTVINEPYESYLVGAVPFKTLMDTLNDISVFSIDEAYRGVEFGAQHASDGWGNKITYAISRHLCDPTTANIHRTDPRGVIDVVIDEKCTDSDGNQYNVSLLPGEGDCKQDNKRYAQFIVLSHGENGRGAYNAQSGTRMDQCIDTSITLPTPGSLGGNADGTGTWTNGHASDRKNCDYQDVDNNNFGSISGNDGEFFAGLRSGDDNEYFDDTIKFYFEDSTSLWQVGPGIYQDNGTPDDRSDDFSISQIINTNVGNIGVGTATPEESLQVDGDIQAFDIYAEGFCDEQTSSTGREVCMNAETLAGNVPEMQCPTGWLVKRVQNNTVECENPFDGANFTCGTNAGGVQLYLQAVYSDGRTTCCDVSDPNNLVCSTN